MRGLCVVAGRWLGEHALAAAVKSEKNISNLHSMLIPPWYVILGPTPATCMQILADIVFKTDSFACLQKVQGWLLLTSCWKSRTAIKRQKKNSLTNTFMLGNNNSHWIPPTMLLREYFCWLRVKLNGNDANQSMVSQTASQRLLWGKWILGINRGQSLNVGP